MACHGSVTYQQPQSEKHPQFLVSSNLLKGPVKHALVKDGGFMRKKLRHKSEITLLLLAAGLDVELSLPSSGKFKSYKNRHNKVLQMKKLAFAGIHPVHQTPKQQREQTVAHLTVFFAATTVITPMVTIV